MEWRASFDEGRAADFSMQARPDSFLRAELRMV
jgi:hypothetical protein